MKLALAAILASLAFAAAAFAQAPDGKTDWTRPVTGVDGVISRAPAEDAAKPVEVFTTIDLKVAPSPDDTPLPPPCDPPVTRAPAAKPPAPAPCPTPPR